MSSFANVSVVKKANVYFGGNVTSRTVLFADGSKKTLGIMLPGEYEFDTSCAELMEIQDGEADILLPGATAWKTFGPGSSFDVAAGHIFKLKVKKVTDYCCSYQ